MQFKTNPLDEIDFYKAGHYSQYPDNTIEVFSNFTPRSSRSDMKHVVVFGIQKVIQDIHENWKKNFFDLNKDQITDLLNEYKEFMDNTIYKDSVSVEHIKDLYNLGYLPLEIKSFPEGTLVPIGVPILTIRNTHRCAYWLVNYLESKLSNALWKPVTSATTAYQFKKRFLEYAEITGASKEFIEFQAHDFSYRGMSGEEDAISSGLAHMSCFVGTDSVPAIKAAKFYEYGDWKKELIGCSVVATEHSVMCAGTKDGELQTFERLLDKFPTNILSVVSDTWDYWKVITEFLPQLKNKIMARDGRLVIRPDSGNPVDIICGVEDGVVHVNSSFKSDKERRDFYEDVILETVREETPHGELGPEYYSLVFEESGIYKKVTITNISWNRYDKQYYFIDMWEKSKFEIEELDPTIYKGTVELMWEIFGGTINDKGYKVLDPHIGLLYGDSITLERQHLILDRLNNKGFTADNLILGIGSYTYEYVTRDTYGMAMKATNVLIQDGDSIISRPIFKDPLTQRGKPFSKTSAKGYLKVVKDEQGEFKLIDKLDTLINLDDELKVVYLNGEQTKDTLSNIREKINNSLNKK